MKFDWHNIWQKKGLEDTRDRRVLDGWELTQMNPEEVARRIKKSLKIKDTDTVLEVGCGAGLLSDFFGDGYVGIDYSKNMVKRSIELNNKSILCCEASDIVFKSNSFDVVFAYSVFQYLPSKEVAKKVISEMERVSRGRVYIGDLPEKSHDENHLLFSLEDFWGWATTTGAYNEDRFDAIKGMTLEGEG